MTTAEFTYDAATHQFVAATGSPASERVDLLTVVMHELGHVLGFEHTDSHGLMNAELPLGTRRLPSDPSEPLSAEKLAVDLTAWNVDALFQRFGGRNDAVRNAGETGNRTVSGFDGSPGNRLVPRGKVMFIPLSELACRALMTSGGGPLQSQRSNGRRAT